MAAPAHLVLVNNVNDGADRQKLGDIFRRHGIVVGVDLIGKGCALVGYAEEEEAEEAIKKIKFELFDGRILKLQKSILFTPEYLQTIENHNYGFCLRYFFCYNWNIYFCLNALPGEVCLRGKHSCFFCFMRDGVLRAHRNRDEECPSRTRGWQDMPQFYSAEIRKRTMTPQNGGQPRQPGPVTRAAVPVTRAAVPVTRAAVQPPPSTPGTSTVPKSRFKFKDTGRRGTGSLLSTFQGILATRQPREDVEPEILNLGDIININTGAGAQASVRQSELVETGSGDWGPQQQQVGDPVPSSVPPPEATSQPDDTFQRCGTGTESSVDIADSEPWGYNPHVNHNPACVSSLASLDSHQFSFYNQANTNYSTNVEGEQGMMGPGGPGMEPSDIFSREPGGVCPRTWRFLPKEPERTQPSMDDITNLYANSSSNLYKDNTPGPAQGRLNTISSLGDSFGDSSTINKGKPTQSSSSTMSRMSAIKSRPINVSGIQHLNQENRNWNLPKKNRTGSVLGPITKYTGTVTHSPVFRPDINASPVYGSDSMGGGNWGGNPGTPWMSGPIQSHPWDDVQSHYLDDGFMGGEGENWPPEEGNPLFF